MCVLTGQCPYTGRKLAKMNSYHLLLIILTLNIVVHMWGLVFQRWFISAFQSFLQWQDEFHIPQSHFYRYWQIRSHVNSILYHTPANLIMKASTFNEEVMTYKVTYDQILMETMISVKLTWEQNVGVLSRSQARRKFSSMNKYPHIK